MATGDVPICSFCGYYAYPSDLGPHNCRHKLYARWEDEPKAFYSVEFLKEDFRKRLYGDINEMPMYTLKEFVNLNLDKDGNIVEKPMNLGTILRNKAEVAADAKVNEAFTKIVSIIHEEAAAGLIETRCNMKVLKLTDDFSIALLIRKLENEGLTCELLVSENSYHVKSKNLLIKW